MTRRNLTSPEPEPKKKAKPTLASITARAEKERDKWLAEMAKDQDGVESAVQEALDNAFEHILEGLFGMTRDRWDRDWRVDHLNGRKSPIYDAVRDRAAAKTLEWVDIALKDLPPPNAKQIKAIRDEFYEALDYQMRDRIIGLANERANQIVDQVLSAVEPVVDGSDSG